MIVNNGFRKITGFSAAAGVAAAALLTGAVKAQDLKPLPVPDWLRKCYYASFTPPQDEAGWKKAALNGVEVAFNIGSVGGYTFYDGKQFYSLEAKKPFSQAKPVNLAAVRSTVAMAQSHGVRVIGSMPPMWEKQVMEAHPEWQRLAAPEAKPGDPYTAELPLNGCWMSSFGDWYIHKNEELVQALGWDGQNIDGFGTYILCYCPACKAAYKKTAGADIPLKTDPGDPNYRRFLAWRLREWGKFVQKWERALKKQKPDFAFIPWSTGPGRWWHWTFLPNAEGSELGNLMVDAPMLELFWDFPPGQSANLLPSFTLRFYRGFCQERPIWLLPYFRSQGQQQAVTPMVESEFRVLTVLTHGGMPVMSDFALPDGVDMNTFHNVVKQRAPWLVNASSMKWAAMLVSENSRLFSSCTTSRLPFSCS